VETALDAPPQAYSNPRVSPDGTRVLVTMRDGGQDVFIWDIARKALRQLTSDEFANNVATWVANDRVAYSSQIAGVQIFLKSTGGANDERQLTDIRGGLYPFSSSPDGALLAATQYPFGGGRPVLAVVPIAAPDQRRVIGPTPGVSGNNPIISPDGRWLAYTSNQTGRPEVYVRSMSDLDAGEFQITHDNARWPAWAKDATELYYVTTSGNDVSINAVPVTKGPPDGWGQSRRIIAGRYSVVGGGDRPYDVYGDRFLVMKEHVPAGPAPRHEIVVVLNFLDELRRRVPAD
jgi:serine/threonine-protein kinase